MDAVGINIGYLAMQVLCFVVFALVVVGATVFVISRTSGMREKKELKLTLPVTENGVLLPASLFENQTEVKVYQQGKFLIVTAVDESL